MTNEGKGNYSSVKMEFDVGLVRGQCFLVRFDHVLDGSHTRIGQFNEDQPFAIVVRCTVFIQPKRMIFRKVSIHRLSETNRCRVSSRLVNGLGSNDETTRRWDERERKVVSSLIRSTSLPMASETFESVTSIGDI